MPFDILMRPERRFGERELSGFWKGKRVVATGAGGTIGRALALRLAQYGCDALGLVDISDHALIHSFESVKRVTPGLAVEDSLCDIRDRARLTDWMKNFRPDIVVHAAALKHVHFGERHPSDCIETNLIGAANAMAAATEAGASHFVLVSSDKAADPVCVMGASKRLAELHLAGLQQRLGGAMRLRAVRFGNVLGSQGSVMPRFLEQIEAGGPVELTHPAMERFFMTIDEAVDFILGAPLLEDPGGEGPAPTLFLEMGQPVSIEWLARELIRRSGRDIEIRTTGVRPGERLTEKLVDQWETVRPTTTPGVYGLSPRATEAFVTQADLDKIRAQARTADGEAVREALFALLRTKLTSADRALRQEKISKHSWAFDWPRGAGGAVIFAAMLSSVVLSRMIPGINQLRYPGLTSLALLVFAIGVSHLLLARGPRGDQSNGRPGASILSFRLVDVLSGTGLFLAALVGLDIAGVI